MGLSFTETKGDGITTTFPFTFVGPDNGYFRDSDIIVEVEGEPVEFTITGPTQVTITGPPVAIGDKILIRRKEPEDRPYTDFTRGNTFGKDNMNRSFQQQLFLTHELMDGYKPEGYYEKQPVDFGGQKIENLAPGTEPGDAINYSQIEGKVDEMQAILDQAEDVAEEVEKLAGEARVGFTVLRYETDVEAETDTIITTFYMDTEVKNVELYLDGVKQTHSSFTLIETLPDKSNIIKLSEDMAVGTHVEVMSTIPVGTGTIEVIYPSPDQSSKLSTYDGDLILLLDAAGSADKTLHIDVPPKPLTADLEIPANINLRHDKGCVITGSVNLTYKGTLSAERYQIFAPPLKVTGLELVYPEWWGDNDVPGTTDMTVPIQFALDSGGNFLAKQGETYRTSDTLFNQIENRTVDFNNATIQNQATGLMYGILTVTKDLINRDANSVAAILKTDHYGAELNNSHVKNAKLVMRPNVTGGGNLGFGLVYAKDSSLSYCEISESDGNGIEMRQCEGCEVHHNTVSGHRNYGIFHFMCKDYRTFKNHINGGSRSIVIKMCHNGTKNVNAKIFQNTIEDPAPFYAIAGATWYETVLTDNIYVPNHEIVKDVEIYGNILIGGTNQPTINIGSFADSWDVHHNTISNPGGAERQLAVAIGTSGNFATGGTVGQNHKIHDNYYSNMNCRDNAFYGAAVSCDIYNEVIKGGEVAKLFYIASSSPVPVIDSIKFRNNVVDTGLTVGGYGDHGILLRESRVKDSVVSCNYLKFKPIAKAGSIHVNPLFVSEGFTRIEDNKLEITYESAGYTYCAGISMYTEGSIYNNDVTIGAGGSVACHGIIVDLKKCYINSNRCTLVGSSSGSTYGLNVTSECEIGRNNTYSGLWGIEFRDGSFKYNYQIGTRRVVFLTTAPTTGNWQQGDIAFKINAFPGGKAGWICTTSGTPGTWKEFGVIST